MEMRKALVIKISYTATAIFSYNSITFLYIYKFSYVYVGSFSTGFRINASLIFILTIFKFKKPFLHFYDISLFNY